MNNIVLTNCQPTFDAGQPIKYKVEEGEGEGGRENGKKQEEKGRKPKKILHDICNFHYFHVRCIDSKHTQILSQNHEEFLINFINRLKV